MCKFRGFYRSYSLSESAQKWKSIIISRQTDGVDENVVPIHPVLVRLVDESSVVGGPSLGAPCFGLAFGAIVCCGPTCDDEDDGPPDAVGGVLAGVGPYDVGCDVPAPVDGALDGVGP